MSSQKLLESLLRHYGQARVSPDGLKLAAEHVRLFLEEAVRRASNEAEAHDDPVKSRNQLKRKRLPRRVMVNVFFSLFSFLGGQARTCGGDFTTVTPGLLSCIYVLSPFIQITASIFLFLF